MQALEKLVRCMEKNTMLDSWVAVDPRFLRFERDVVARLSEMSPLELGGASYWIGRLGVCRSDTVAKVNAEVSTRIKDMPPIALAQLARGYAELAHCDHDVPGKLLLALSNEVVRKMGEFKDRRALAEVTQPYPRQPEAPS